VACEAALMKQIRTSLMLLLAFAAGAFVARLPETARAAAPPVVATSIDLNALTPSDFPPPNPLLPNLRTKTLAQVDSTVVAYAVGTAPKHIHAGTTELQLFLAGTGTEWLGDKQIPIGPGTFVIVPPNTPHGGFTGGPFHIYTVKTPPQDPTDYHMVP
jgi:mannose-6-phosphate isomerase-like protein (cupin superfamily)